LTRAFALAVFRSFSRFWPVHAPKNKKRDGKNCGHPEYQTYCLAFGPIAICFPSACQLSGAKQDDHRHKQDRRMLGSKSNANGESAQNRAWPRHLFHEAIERVDRGENPKAAPVFVATNGAFTSTVGSNTKSVSVMRPATGANISSQAKRAGTRAPWQKPAPPCAYETAAHPRCNGRRRRDRCGRAAPGRQRRALP
jgi:hypothetical protein